MTGTNCDLFTHKSSQSYLNHLVLTQKIYHSLNATVAQLKNYPFRVNTNTEFNTVKQKLQTTTKPKDNPFKTLPKYYKRTWFLTYVTVAFSERHAQTPLCKSANLRFCFKFLSLKHQSVILISPQCRRV
jgi:hypothetical protein